VYFDKEGLMINQCEYKLGKPVEGKHIDYHHNGDIYEETFYKDFKKHGTSILYFK
jgi:antitoxin component YwqK of YwqJK toxin-antitoxin module